MTAQTDRQKAASAFIARRLPGLRAMRTDYLKNRGLHPGQSSTCPHRKPRPDCEGCAARHYRAERAADCAAEILVLELVRDGHLSIDEGLDWSEPVQDDAAAPAFEQMALI